MQLSERPISGLFDVTFPPAVDHRGYLVKPYNEQEFKEAGIDVTWRQIIMQQTERKNTMKGLHIQMAPFTEGKLVVPVAGRVMWVSIDFRKNSPTFLKWEKTILEPGGPAWFAPRGMAHGCLHLTDNTLLLIAADNLHSEEHGVGIAWNDPDIAIDWPVDDAAALIMKDAHRQSPPFADVRQRLGL